MFCHLTKDEKTFMYVRDYIRVWQSQSDTTASFAVLDNLLQHKEIIDHLKNNGFDRKDSQHVFEWITTNGQSFRSYLNTIKLVFMVWHCSGNNWKDITWDDFCNISDRLVEIKDTCLDTIMIERSVKSEVNACLSV